MSLKKKTKKPDHRLAVLGELRKGQALTPMEIAFRLEISPRRVSAALTDLAKISEALPGRGSLCLAVKIEAGALASRWSLHENPNPQKEST